MVYIQQVLKWENTKPPDVQAVIDTMATSRLTRFGAVFTKREVAEFVLDLAGYIDEEDLTQLSFLEPSCGRGDFLLPALERLLNSYAHHQKSNQEIVSTLRNAVRAVELHHDTFIATRNSALNLLIKRGVQQQDANELVDAWFVNDDFLLADLLPHFTHIVGNPPYVRQELLPDVLLCYYKNLYQTIYDRADLYIPFIERSLSLLASDGKLAFICSDRWMKNKYGGPLRELISKHFHLQYYIDMTGTDAFQTNVTAYPAITMISTHKDAYTYIIRQPPLDYTSLRTIANMMRTHERESNKIVQVLTDVMTSGSQPWTLSTSEERILLHRLEQEFPLIEEVGCKIGIGVATGCDSVFIQPQQELLIEEDRKIPLLMTSDIQTGLIAWSGKVVINPFKPNGELVNLREYPKLRAYFLAWEADIKKRNVAKRNPGAWYRTIDRIYEPLTHQPKLLIPDIKAKPHVVYDEGHYYPHHNLYFVTSASWDLRALQAVLRSSLAKFFVATYSVKMRGGYLRFQAQNMRRIRLPAWETVSPALRERLRVAAVTGTIEDCNNATFDLYRISKVEQALLETFKSIKGS